MAKKTTKKTDTDKPKKKTAFMKPVTVSEVLSTVVGAGPMPRADVTRKLWDYIKENKLQDTTNKRMINPDANLAEVFGSADQIDMFQMAGKISKHLTNPTTAAV